MGNLVLVLWLVRSFCRFVDDARKAMDSEPLLDNAPKLGQNQNKGNETEESFAESDVSDGEDYYRPEDLLDGIAKEVVEAYPHLYEQVPIGEVNVSPVDDQ